MEQAKHLYVSVDGLDVFYREAGPPEGPTLLLLHGFPSSSIQFRYMLAELSDRWHLLAPDLPGFGFTRVNGSSQYSFTFDGLAETIRRFLEKTRLDISAAYLHDFGCHVGFRLLTSGTIRPRALIIQSTEAYHGVGWHGPLWDLEKKLNGPPEQARSEFIKNPLNREGIRKEFVEELPSAIAERIDPAIIELGWSKINSPQILDAMLDLHLDYRSNIQQYPKVQAYFRASGTPTLVVWGDRDQYLSIEAAHAYRRDLPNMELSVLDGGHWLLESHSHEVNVAVRNFLSTHIGS